MPLPHLGIGQPVRVCETCYQERSEPKQIKSPAVGAVSSPIGPVNANRSMQPRSARVEDDDDKDLKLALQMSLEDAKRTSTSSQPPPFQAAPPQAAIQSNVQNAEQGEDEDLKAAIAASLKDMESKKTMQYPSIQQTGQQASQQTPQSALPATAPSQFQVSSVELSALEAENITLFATLIERMQSSPPGAILREPRIQELYEAVSAFKPKLGRTLSTVVGKYGTSSRLRTDHRIPR
jgi:hepatocyte growth factor-regulated tyrosine kinase substrate